jgi:SAM-dependent methyltransferase
VSAQSDRLFAQLAPDYDEHFAVAHRRAYDELSWELTLAELPPAPAVVVDVGCGTGRWARRLTTLGYQVIGIEPCAAMREQAQRRQPDLRVLPTDAAGAELATESADAVLAMGSLQYSSDPRADFARVARWLRPGGCLCLLVDSRVALGIELLRAGRPDEARDRLDSGIGHWQVGELSAELVLFDRDSLTSALAAAGLESPRVQGLLVGASVWGRAGLTERLQAGWATALADERALAARTDLADLGKQLFAVGRRAGRGRAR